MPKSSPAQTPSVLPRQLAFPFAPPLPEPRKPANPVAAPSRPSASPVPALFRRRPPIRPMRVLIWAGIVFTFCLGLIGFFLLQRDGLLAAGGLLAAAIMFCRDK